MPRPQKSRKICNPPKMSGFKPFGIALCDVESVKLTLEEYESIKLVNYEMLPQEQAAEQMNVSRPTFTRIYNKALKNIAKAFVEGKAIVIEGGSYELENEWYKCRKCYKLIEGLENHTKCSNCTLYGKDELININQLSDDKK
ncbi:MAG: DUF134 domain-containing protein [Breznakibacter sp.]|jgi:predicted DNA-binding protein (UPF0251 family)|nr:DUF134 domain-containing protein [Breznakibacter sp.]